jgi:hypothetical protein
MQVKMINQNSSWQGCSCVHGQFTLWLKKNASFSQKKSAVLA